MKPDAKAEALREVMDSAAANGEFGLVWDDIADRAGIARATAYRRKDVHAEWTSKVAAHIHEGQRSEKKTSATGDDRPEGGTKKRDLERRLTQMAIHTELLVALLRSRDQHIATLEAQLRGMGSVVRLHPKLPPAQSPSH